MASSRKKELSNRSVIAKERSNDVFFFPGGFISETTLLSVLFSPSEIVGDGS